ncbi:MAG: PAS domain-containing protein, partial [Desulfovibrionales bacterium]|nr:PAS domain-containing protein [Desulfovibrionales bacterium]
MLDPSPAFDFSSFPVPRDLIENAPIGIFQSCMTTRRFTWMNQVMARCLGYDSPSACIDSIKDIPRDLYLRSANRRLLMDRVETRGQIFNFESRFRRRDGGVVRGKIHARVAPGGELL